MHTSANSHHVSGSHMIYWANQNEPEDCILQTRQDAANQHQLKQGSTYDVVTSRCE